MRANTEARCSGTKKDNTGKAGIEGEREREREREREKEGGRVRTVVRLGG